MPELVFLNYDQKQLDDAYDQNVYAKNREQIQARCAVNSELVRDRLGHPIRLAYGPSDIEKLDVYRSHARNAPVHVYFHGGAWRAGLAKNYGYPAEMFMRAGAHYLVPDFSNVVETGGDLLPIAKQVKRSIAWTYKNAATFDGDRDRLYVSGSSSGAHLAGVLATTDWEKEFELPPDVIKGYVLTSGMYDLRGPRLSKRSEYVKFTDDVEDALSPQRHLDKIRAPVVLIYGSLETPEFQRQSCDFAAALADGGKTVRLICAQGYNHFEVAETIANPLGAVGRAVLDQMKLKAQHSSR